VSAEAFIYFQGQQLTIAIYGHYRKPASTVSYKKLVRYSEISRNLSIRDIWAIFGA
jgi:hypothetical protein